MAPDNAAGAGTGLGDFVVEATLGSGGSATVYLAQDTAEGRRVALKVLGEQHRGAADRERLRREYRLAARVRHPHIVDVYRLGPHWLTMQYVDGGNAATLPARGDRLTGLAQIADALDHAHRLGIVHCDVKPANILVFRDFAACGAMLIDFGVAHAVAEDMARRLGTDLSGPAHFSLDPARRITHERAPRPVHVMASLPYAAPELLVGRVPSAATDEYGLACAAVELLTGAPPFAGTDASHLADAQIHEPPPRISQRTPQLPRAVDAVVATALAKNPEERYESCRAFVDALTRALR